MSIKMSTPPPLPPRPVMDADARAELTRHVARMAAQRRPSDIRTRSAPQRPPQPPRPASPASPASPRSPAYSSSRGSALTAHVFTATGEAHPPMLPGEAGLAPDTWDGNALPERFRPAPPSRALGSRGMGWALRAVQMLHEDAFSAEEAEDSNAAAGCEASGSDARGPDDLSAAARLWSTRRLAQAGSELRPRTWWPSGTARVKAVASESRPSSAGSPPPQGQPSLSRPPSLETPDSGGREPSVSAVSGGGGGGDASALLHPIPFVPPVLKGYSPGPLPLSDAIANRTFRRALRQYLDDNYCGENLEFLEAAAEYRALPAEGRPAAARALYDEFVSSDAARQVNLPSRAAAACGEALAGAAPDLFEACADAVHRMVERDVYVRFCDTALYRATLVGVLEEQLSRPDTGLATLKGSGWDISLGHRSLHLDVVAARSLVGGRRTDPYVTVTLSGRRYRTQRLRKTGDPEWNEHFELPLAPTDQYVELGVWGSALLSSDTFLGGVYLPVSHVCRLPQPPAQEPPAPWYALMAAGPGAAAGAGRRSSAESALDAGSALQVRAWLSPDEPRAEFLGGAADGAADGHVAVAGVLARRRADREHVRRLRDGGFDLDLSYVGDRVLAMACPGGTSATHRLRDVCKFLEQRHPGSFRVFSLCTDEPYDSSAFGGRVTRFPVPDGCPPPFLSLPRVAREVAEWLAAHPQNVAAVHCSNGRERTGVAVAAYLLRSRPDECDTAAAALRVFDRARMQKGHAAVSVPSQQRYVEYAAEYFARERRLGGDAGSTDASAVLPQRVMFLSRVSLVNVPTALRQPSAEVWFVATHLYTNMQSRSRVVARLEGATLEFVCGESVPLCEDVRIEFFHGGGRFGRPEPLFHFWFNTRFIEHGTLALSKRELDGACADTQHRQFPANFAVLAELAETRAEAVPHPGSRRVIRRQRRRRASVQHHQRHRNPSRRLTDPVGRGGSMCLSALSGLEQPPSPSGSEAGSVASSSRASAPSAPPPPSSPPPTKQPTLAAPPPAALVKRPKSPRRAPPPLPAEAVTARAPLPAPQAQARPKTPQKAPPPVPAKPRPPTLVVVTGEGGGEPRRAPAAAATIQQRMAMLGANFLPPSPQVSPQASPHVSPKVSPKSSRDPSPVPSDSAPEMRHPTTRRPLAPKTQHVMHLARFRASSGGEQNE